MSTCNRLNLQTLGSQPIMPNILPDHWSNQCLGRTGGQLHMNRLSTRNNQLKFKILGNLPIILEEFIEYTSN